VKRAVFDSSALVALYENEPGAAMVGELIRLANDRKYQLLMSVVNWGEVYYIVWRGRGPGVARKVLGDIAQLPISLVPADLELTRLSAELKAEYKLPYADCFAASLAVQRHAVLVTCDSDFSFLAKKISVLWLK
jgi:predicted nucleic acid-binding protein